MSANTAQLEIGQYNNTNSRNTPVSKSPNYEATLIIKRSKEGECMEILDELPDADTQTRSLNELETTAKGTSEYPREHTHATISLYNYRLSMKNASASQLSAIKKFNISINRNTRPGEIPRVKTLLSDLAELDELQNTIKEIESFEGLRDKADTVRAYESRYNVLRSIFKQDTICQAVTGENEQHPREFKITQGFGEYIVPRLYSGHANDIIGTRLEELGIGSYCVMAGGFVIKSGCFDDAHEVLEPFYK